ncbi:MAG: vitamin B12-dependent ribonucleotide reductase [Desulfobacteraceae bacterium]|nr:vitamin B12-dependent ribonucleotide reductase [Desulfobacteraceae bacterium]
MSHKAKQIKVSEAGIDLCGYSWDNETFVQLLVQKYGFGQKQAKPVSRFIEQSMDLLKIRSITPPVFDTIVTSSLECAGIFGDFSIPLDISYFNKNGIVLTKNAKTVLQRRYLRKDADGNVIESASQMFRRVARHIAAADLKYDPEADAGKLEQCFYDVMAEMKFLPNSPALINAGTKLGQLASCFVLPVHDSMEAIFETLKNAAVIHKSGGGTGFSFSRLRPKNSVVGTTGGVASGPVSFMKIFNTATEQVKQGGTRRGANMAVLKVDHPDIMEFILCKQYNDELNNFNISVALTDRFMEAVEKGESYDLIDPHTGKKTASGSAREVYTTLVKQAWKNGDPGILFLDRINADNPTPGLGGIESTNPCGEQPLLPMEACNLGSINLACFAAKTQNGVAIDYEALAKTVRTAIHFLDNTIDMSNYPLDEIDRMTKGNRKVGLGVMGFADLLFQLEIPYNSEAGLAIAHEVMGFIRQESKAASEALAVKRGPFPNFKDSIFHARNQAPLRNATTTTIAPTGTLSIIANCSSGIEPLFALSFVRKVMDDDKLIEVNPFFEQVAKSQGFYSYELMRKICQKGSIRDIEGIPGNVKSVFVTAHDISPEWHIRIQAAFQAHTDNAVSKTANLPKNCTHKDIRLIYDLAYESRLKGVTIYRDGSKDNQVLSTGACQGAVEGLLTVVRKRPETLKGFTTKIRTGLGQLYVTVTEFNGRPFEVFVTIGKSGRSTTAKTEAIGRLVSLALRSGVDVREIIEQLKGIGGEHPVFQDDGLVLSIPDAISRVLERRYVKDSRANTKTENRLIGAVCPECSQTISYEEGCQICHFCGYTKCD